MITNGMCKNFPAVTPYKTMPYRTWSRKSACSRPHAKRGNCSTEQLPNLPGIWGGRSNLHSDWPKNLTKLDTGSIWPRSHNTVPYFIWQAENELMQYYNFIPQKKHTRLTHRGAKLLYINIHLFLSPSKSNFVASPKSPTLMSISSFRKRLPSFRSLWITLLLCRYWQALTTWRTKYRASGSVTAFLLLWSSMRDYNRSTRNTEHGSQTANEWQTKCRPYGE